MAARAGGPPGGAQVITTLNQGNVVSTQVPSLNFDGQNAGELIKTITGIQPNMISGVTLDNTYVGHQQYRYLPYPVNNRTMTFQWTTPNWCHVRDVALNLQMFFRLGGESGNCRSQLWNQDDIWQTARTIKAGGYHITNGGLLSMLQNLRIKLGAQVDILTAFEKTKSGFHILNTWLHGKWNQKTIFALIDRWDAWYGIQHNWAVQQVVNPAQKTYTSLLRGSNNDIVPSQSDCIYERLLSRTLADKGLLREAGGSSIASGTDRFTELIENVSIPFTCLHSLFQQNIMLPPGMQFIIEVDLPMYANYNYAVVQRTPVSANWACLGYVQNVQGDTQAWNNTDDLTFQPVTNWPSTLAILGAVSQDSQFNCITMNCVNLKPEVARSLQDARIKNPLVYNAKQMVATQVGSFFPGQSVYNFTLPPNQAIPTQFLFAWIQPSSGIQTISAPIGGATSQSASAPTYYWNAGLYNCQTATVVPTPTAATTAFDGPAPDAFYAGTGGNTIYTSNTPLPVYYKRVIVRRGGFQEIFQYGTYYDGLGIYSGYNAMPPTAGLPSTIDNNRTIQNACSFLGAKNLTPDSTQTYFSHLEEYQWDRCSLNGLGPIERRMKFAYTPQPFTEGRWDCFQVNPCKNDVGQYSSDQNAYSVDVQIEFDFSWPNSEAHMMLNANAKLVCVRVLPSQISYAIDGTVRLYTWPNLLISPNAVVSGNPPPAGPGGSI